MILELDIDFKISDIVYVKTDVEQVGLMVVKIVIEGIDNSVIMYGLREGANVNYYYEYELSSTRDDILKMTSQYKKEEE